MFLFLPKMLIVLINRINCIKLGFDRSSVTTEQTKAAKRFSRVNVVSGKQLFSEIWSHFAQIEFPLLIVNISIMLSS